MCDSVAFADRPAKFTVPLIWFSTSSNTKVPEPLAPVPVGGISLAGLRVAVKLKRVAEALPQSIEVKAATVNNLRIPLAGFFIRVTSFRLRPSVLRLTVPTTEQFRIRWAVKL